VSGTRWDNLNVDLDFYVLGYFAFAVEGKPARHIAPVSAGSK
jgi:hypothetical protein